MPQERKPARLVKLANSRNFFIAHHNGRRDVRVSTGTADIGRAQEELAKFIRRQVAPVRRRRRDPDEVIIAELIELWVTLHVSKLPAGRRQIDAAEHVLEFMGHLPVSSIDTRLADAYVKHRNAQALERRGRELAPSTLYQELGALRAAVNWGESKKGRILTDAPAVPVPQPSPRRKGALKPWQVKALLDACTQPYQRLFVLLAVATSQRKQAILELLWQQVDFQRRLIDFNPPGRLQTSKGRPVVPINDELLRALRRARARARTPYVIELSPAQAKRIRAKRLAPLRELGRGFRAAVKRAGISLFGGTRITPHTLRHTAGTRMAQKKVDILRIRDFMGHKDIRSTMIYIDLEPEHLREAARALEMGLDERRRKPRRSGRRGRNARRGGAD